MRKINEINNINYIPRYLALYFLKAILLDKKFITKCPSIIVVVVYYLVYYILGISKWVRFLIALTYLKFNVLILSKTPLYIRISEYNYS